MKATYETTIVTRCPVNGDRDVYAVTIESDTQISCETINQTIDEWSNESCYQEILTQYLATELAAKVITSGIHSGVTVTVVAEP
jgi:hypothetical protein